MKVLSGVNPPMWELVQSSSLAPASPCPVPHDFAHVSKGCGPSEPCWHQALVTWGGQHSEPTHSITSVSLLGAV